MLVERHGSTMGGLLDIEALTGSKAGFDSFMKDFWKEVVIIVHEFHSKRSYVL